MLTKVIIKVGKDPIFIQDRNNTLHHPLDRTPALIEMREVIADK